MEAESERKIYRINKRYHIDFSQDLQEDINKCEEYIKKHRIPMNPRYPSAFFNPSYRIDESKERTDLILDLYISFEGFEQLFMVEGLEKILERKAKSVDSIPALMRCYSDE